MQTIQWTRQTPGITPATDTLTLVSLPYAGDDYGVLVTSVRGYEGIYAPDGRSVYSQDPGEGCYSTPTEAPQAVIDSIESAWTGLTRLVSAQPAQTDAAARVRCAIDTLLAVSFARVPDAVRTARDPIPGSLAALAWSELHAGPRRAIVLLDRAGLESVDAALKAGLIKVLPPLSE